MYRIQLRYFVALLLAVGMLFAAVAVLAESITVDTTGTVDTGNISFGRIFRNGVPSDCAGKAYPGVFGSTELGYTIEGSFGPVLSDSCITVT